MFSLGNCGTRVSHASASCCWVVNFASLLASTVLLARSIGSGLAQAEKYVIIVFALTGFGIAICIGDIGAKNNMVEEVVGIIVSGVFDK